MKTCPLEDQVRRDPAGGSRDQALRDHAARCPVCRDVLAVSDWMLRFRDLTLDQIRTDGSLPAPGGLWDLARAGRPLNPAVVRRALSPIFLSQKIAWFVSVAAGVALTLLEFGRIKGLLASIPGFSWLAETMRNAGETGAASPVQLAALTAAFGLSGILVLILVTGLRRLDTG